MEILPTLSANHVQCVITSPPYWGLRKYGEDAREIGSEKTFEEYVAKITAVFEEVRRVLRPDGTLWLNMGDSYAGSWGNYGGKNRGRGMQRDIPKGSKVHQKAWDGREGERPASSWTKNTGLKPKDLIGQPWAVAFALRAAGWYLRQDMIWFKKNPMPESCTDRPTRAHEYFFLLSKSQRYFYDSDAIREPGNGSTEKRVGQANFQNQTGGPKDSGTGNRSHRKLLKNLAKRKPSGWNSGHTEDDKKGRYSHKEGPNSAMNKTHVPGAEDSKPNPSGANNRDPVMTRNKRSVWEIATAPFAEAHYATFPPALVLPAVLAGSRPGDRVLDPFSGAGTVGKVAIERGRKFTGIELYAKNLEITDRRMARVQPGFAF